MSSSASLSGRLRSFISRSQRMRWAISGVTGPRSSASAAADCAANDVGVGVIASARPSGVAPPKPPTGVAPPAAAPLSTMGVSSQRDRLPPDSAATGAVGVESQRLALAGASSRAGVSIQRDALAAATSRPGVLSQRAAPELGVSSKPVILSLVARSASTNKDAAQVRPGVEPQRAPSVAGVISTTIARAQGRESHRAVEALRICARSAPRIASRGRCSPEDDMAPSLPRRVADAGRRAAPGRYLRRRSASGSRRAQGEARLRQLRLTAPIYSETPEAAVALSEDIRQLRVRKVYLARVAGDFRAVDAAARGLRCAARALGGPAPEPPGPPAPEPTGACLLYTSPSPRD